MTRPLAAVRSRRPVANAACLAILTLLTGACGRGLVTLPDGASAPVDPAEAAGALAQATMGCAAVRSMTAEVAVSGSAGGRRLRGRLLGGVAAPASVRLEAVAPFGQPLFIFVATGDVATLLLPRDERVLEGGRPDAVLEAVAGVPLGAPDLTNALTGCAASKPPPSATARRFGDSWIVVGDVDGELYLRREDADGPWELVATTQRGAAPDRRWRAEYSQREAAVPRAIRVVSLDEGGTTGRVFDLRLDVSQVEINTPLDAAAFKVQVPPSAIPITLNELRASGPLAPQ
jgi:outer membrane lipoprotein-sorting protein